jgi:hypothetical protein
MSNMALGTSAFRVRWLARASACVIVLSTAGKLWASDSVVIGAIGDFGGAAEGATFAANELAVANLVKRWNPHFIITTGDNNYRDGAASTIDPNIGQFYHEYIYPYTGTYGSGATSNRFFPCLGNHDWAAANGLPYLNYFSLPGNERYYSYRYGQVEIFAINSNPDPDGTTSTSIQATWLRNRLAASTARWKLVYFHHPPYSADLNGAAEVNLRWPFAAWGAAAVLAGHVHIYARIHTNNMVYFINGLGGESIGAFGGISASAVRYNGDYGAMRIEATDTNLVFHFVTRNNVIVDTFVLGDPIWSPFVLSPPLSQTVPAGRTVTFNVFATGPAPLRYQWQFNASNLPGATNSALVITNPQPAQEGNYSVIVSSGTASIPSAVARLTLLRHPLITLQPQSQSVSGGATVTFRVAAEGAGALRFQWFFNGTPIAGATATNLILTNVQLTAIGDYTVLVTDDLGSVLSGAASLVVRVKPTVTEHPVSQSAAVGESVVLSVAAAGTLPMNYSWRLNGRIVTNIMLNQGTCFWTIHNVQLTNAGDYRVGITNAAGPASGLTSNAVLTVLEDHDGDGLPDTWETANGFNPDDLSDAGLDADGDSLSNLQEYLAGTDPKSGESYLRVEKISPAPDGKWRIEFMAASNKTYSVEFRNDAPTGNWSLLAEFTAAPTNRLVEVIDATTPGSVPTRFYRLATPRLP